MKLYFKVVEDQNRYTKEDQRKKMKNKENEIQTDRNEILKIYARFFTQNCTVLHSKTNTPN